MEIAAMFYKRSFGRDISPEYCREIAADKSQCVLAHGDIPLMEGAYDTVRAVKEAGVMPIVITGSSQPSLFTKLDRMFDSMLCADCMVTAFDVRKGKPDPEPYLTGMEKAGVGASEAIVVENSPLGVRSGKAAGAFTIAVNTGPLPDSALKEAGADMIFPSMRVLSSKIKDIISSLN